METILEKQKKMFTTLKDKFGYVNTMQTPRLEKIIVSVGTGSVKDKSKAELIIDRLGRITGQKPKSNAAKKSIATFKLREGSIIGYQVTLRGKRMNDFFDKLVHVVLPRTRDFRGLPLNAIDDMGNYTIGIKEHTIFPETSDEDLRDVFGLGVTMVTTAKTKDEAEALLRELGLPLREYKKPE
jgi:large subunit ribosomal protein L5